VTLGDIFDGFTIDLDILLGIVQASFTTTWPNSPYVSHQQDVLHQMVNMIAIYILSEHHLQPL
jgi:hypothetical protein